MTYELAKKLKDTGFPQEKNRGILWTFDGSTADPLDIREPVYEPTLSELIEACEPYFKTLELVNYLNNTPDTWFTIAYKLAVEYRESGQTAEEAMANLWLKLNAK